MEELRTAIWDLLYHAKRALSIREIADSVQEDAEVIQQAVQHSWFTVDGDLVGISQS